MEEATGAPSSLTDWGPKRLRASGRDGGLSHDDATPVSSHNAPFPSYKAPRVHDAARWRSSVAARDARTAAREGADHRFLGLEYGFDSEPMGRSFRAAAARTRLDRGSHHRDRVS